MSETEPDPAELIGEMADAQDWIHEATRDLLFWTSLTLLGVFLLGYLVLFGVGIAVFAAIWLLRKHQIVWAGVGLVIGLTGLVLFGSLRYFQEPTTEMWIDLGLVSVLALELMAATWAAVRYQRLSTLFQKRVGAAGSATSNHALEPTTGARHCSEGR